MTTNTTAARTSIGESAMRIMRRLIGHPPQTISELAKSLNVTRTAVTEQINELIALHLVRQTRQHGGRRGRPCCLFSATDLAMRRLFDGNQDIVVPAMWRSIREHFGDEAVDMVVFDIARELAEKYAPLITSTTLRGRMQEFVMILARHGWLVELHERSTHFELLKFNCPFGSMADDTGTLCCIDRFAMQLIVGNGQVAPIRLVQSRNDGNHCCVFHLDLHSKPTSKFCNCGSDI